MAGVFLFESTPVRTYRVCPWLKITGLVHGDWQLRLGDQRPCRIHSLHAAARIFTWVKGKMVRGGSWKRAEPMKALDGFEMKRVTFLSEKRTIRIRSKQSLKPVEML